LSYVFKQLERVGRLRTQDDGLSLIDHGARGSAIANPELLDVFDGGFGMTINDDDVLWAAAARVQHALDQG
ncbi:MAG TPA: hypothetical protein VHY59_08815, partial [Chthoniobacterales bacterium]|jgi:hypothetical protein|nr:hypothetical protein [Chthoniobacterales bacterium]